MASGAMPELERLAGTEAEEPRTGARRPRRARGGRALLVGTPREVLARLAPHDPLDVRALVAERLAARFLLMDADRVHAGALARIAREARHYGGTPALEAWLARQVDATIDALRAAEAQLAAEATPLEEAGAWRELARPLGLEPAAMRRSCARFNLLSRAEREAFVRLVLERGSADALARAAGLSLSALALKARRAVDLFLEAEGGES